MEMPRLLLMGKQRIVAHQDYTALKGVTNTFQTLGHIYFYRECYKDNQIK